MNKRHDQLIRQAYQRRDFSALFHTILSVADETSLDDALACLERCVTEKRLSWIDAHLASLEKMGNIVGDAYRIFYEVYLGIAPPADGEIVERTAGKLVTRWWNPCPVLEACQEVGLDTRVVCRKAYHQPVQTFLSQIDPRLRFDRNYDCLRPHTPYCEEIIYLEP